MNKPLCIDLRNTDRNKTLQCCVCKAAELEMSDSVQEKKKKTHFEKTAF